MDSKSNGPIAGESRASDGSPVGHLYAIVQRHIDTYGVREAELARRVGTSPQTINSWKNRGVRGLPSREILRKLADVTRTAYGDVLEAALMDAGYIDPRPAPEADSRRRQA